MTEERLAKIIAKINGEEEPETLWFVDTIRELVDEIVRLKALQK